MRSIIGDQMLKMAVYKFQSQVDEAAFFQLLHKKLKFRNLCVLTLCQNLIQASRNSPTVPGQFPQSPASQQQYSQMPTDGTFVL